MRGYRKYTDEQVITLAEEIKTTKCTYTYLAESYSMPLSSVGYLMYIRLRTISVPLYEATRVVVNAHKKSGRRKWKS